ncbi:hypothetical protein TSTA_053050 [Talaromyces stipitatus ATCC 10500]|uniref:Uncharacterized protein n=1 Tax=Talaromyces stipitatus (strain ATCC 10500 / CBS 375.48 / QM 6759 / NRRL 1006) TaxID=441959 RepID=B8MQV2_TALSN|nr:uncharacterized protein TSTA_053050 [Talaromyces stipitatus ATCC 10500]EED12787.1 hypothetical protein TSTA_053050 [Talaromyces stipitatus ATCC 10500]
MGLLGRGPSTLRHVALGRAKYCCWFAEDQGSTAISPSVSDCLASFQKKANERDQLSGMSDLQVINIEGLFTYELKPCGYTWSCSFKERYTPPQTEISSHEEHLAPGEDNPLENNEVSQRVEIPVSSKGNEYTPAEDKLIVLLHTFMEERKALFKYDTTNLGKILRIQLAVANIAYGSHVNLRIVIKVFRYIYESKDIRQP